MLFENTQLFESSHQVLQGDCLVVLDAIAENSIDLAYLDPPFFTNKVQSLGNRERSKQFSFEDVWNDYHDYAEFMLLRLEKVKQVLKTSGSIFVHCDRNANHMIRMMLDEVFGENNFRSEIIWSYKRWSNAQKGLLPAHQTIFFYSKSENYVFNTIHTDYSESTNVDQILQKRERDEHGKAVYARHENGDYVQSNPKKGVPLSDVWEIPFLNPKAKERVGYPTQKPLLLLEQIIEIASHPGATVLDPFCGSGTTLVAAKLLGRNSVGIDVSSEATEITKTRLANPVRTDSQLLRKGRGAYLNADFEALGLLEGLELIPIHRNAGMDAILKTFFMEKPVPVRVQRSGEPLLDAAQKLYKAALSKNARRAFLVQTSAEPSHLSAPMTEVLRVVTATSLEIKKQLGQAELEKILELW
jgi:site-specific DNA-methyltransferase (adenine-specific)